MVGTNAGEQLHARSRGHESILVYAIDFMLIGEVIYIDTDVSAYPYVFVKCVQLIGQVLGIRNSLFPYPGLGCCFGCLCVLDLCIFLFPAT